MEWIQIILQEVYLVTHCLIYYQKIVILNMHKQFQINIIEWENSISFSEAENDFFSKLDILNQDNRKLESTPHESSSDFQRAPNQMDPDIGWLERVNSLDSDSIEKLDELVQILKEFQSNFKSLQDDKTLLVEKISIFYSESYNLINQQKQLLAIIDGIQENLQYYNNLPMMDSKINTIQNDLRYKEVYETQLQRLISEVYDSISFFQANENFKNSELYLDQYIQLKQKLISIIKSLFLKIFNKRLQESEHWNIKNNQMHSFHPEIVHLYEPNTVPLVNEALRNLLNSLQDMQNYDIELNEILNEIFEKQVFQQLLRQVIDQQNHEHFQTMITYSKKMLFLEYFSYAYLFQFNQKNERIINLLQQLFSIIIDHSRIFMAQESNIDQLVQSMTFIATVQDENFSYIDPAIASLAEGITRYYESLFKEVMLRIQKQFMQKLLQLTQHYIQEKIVNFDTRYIQEPQQRNRVFPIIQSAIYLINILQRHMNQDVQKQLTFEIVTNSLNQLYLASQNFQDKFDSFLFLIKNLIILDETLQGDYMIKQQELDFSSTKNVLLELIYQQNDNNEGFGFWNVIQSIYKGLPKVNHYTIDLKKNLQEQIQNTNEKYLRDMSFIIGKNLCDFLKKQKQLQKIINNYESDAEIDDCKKDLQNIMEKQNIKKNYALFMENLFDSIKEMVEKMNNNLTNDIFDKVKIYICAILDNLMIFLRQFYIAISEQYHILSSIYSYLNEDYLEFQFEDIEVLTKKLKSLIFYVEE